MHEINSVDYYIITQLHSLQSKTVLVGKHNEQFFLLTNQNLDLPDTIWLNILYYSVYETGNR